MAPSPYVLVSDDSSVLSPNSPHAKKFQNSTIQVHFTPSIFQFFPGNNHFALGVDGMEEVYRARDTKLDRTVAIKILPAEVASDRELMRRFVREAKAGSAITHVPTFMKLENPTAPASLP
jgi:hypothetical protein